MSASDTPNLQRQFYDMLLASQHWPADRMEAHQRSQLGQLLRHARRNVPFYAHRLDVLFRPGGEIDWDRWRDVPILTRADLRDHRDEMQARELPAGHGPTLVRSSSGSTGMPISITHNRLAALASDASMARAQTWHGVDFDRNLVNITGDDPQEGAYPEGSLGEHWCPPFMQAEGRYWSLNLLATPAEQLEFVGRRQPAYLAGVTSRIHAVALEAERQGVTLPVGTIMTRAEGVPASTRALFASAFEAGTLEMYSAEEATRLAFNCEQSDRLHVCSEVALIEILDSAGHPCPAGVQGRVIVTVFFNTAQPIIRYELGDLAVWGTSCKCGRTLPVLEPVAGRISHLFVLPDGRRFLPNVGDEDMVRLGVATWQLAQVAPDRVEFRYVPRDPDNAPPDSDLLAALCVGQLAELQFAIRRLPQLARKPGEKHISYKNEIAR